RAVEHVGKHEDEHRKRCPPQLPDRIQRQRSDHRARRADDRDAVGRQARPQRGLGDRRRELRVRRAGHQVEVAHGWLAHSVASSSRVSRSSCGTTLEPPMIVMKLASPLHRGTTCMCRCSASEPPADFPRLSPTLKPCGCDTDLMTRITFWVNAISSALSSSVRSSSSETRRYGTTIEWPGLYG